MSTSTDTPTADYDGAWKKAFERYFQPIVELCFPDVAAAIDWSQRVEFLNTELQKITHDAAKGKRYVDILVCVTLRTGQRELILLHVEVQVQYDDSVEERTFDYNIRIRLRYREPVVSLVILGDERADWKPNVYHQSKLGCEVRFQYPVCKLLEVAKRAEHLPEPKSPAVMIILAHVRALETHGDMKLRLEHKWQLLRDMYARGWGREEFLGVYQLLDWFLRLPKPETLIFEERVIAYEKEQHMDYITSIEQLGIERGRVKGESELLAEMLCDRFPTLHALTIEDQLRSLSSEKRRELAKKLLRFTSLDEAQAWIQQSLQ